jgi:hypothetical protein
MTDDGTYDELEKALNGIRKLPHKLKVIIPGMNILSLFSMKPLAYGSLPTLDTSAVADSRL